MEFGIINLANALILVGILIPNVVYAAKGGEDLASDNQIVTVLEQVGRYASMALMILPLGVWKFGFPNVLALLVYLAGNGLLLIAYWSGWGLYFKRKTFAVEILLAVAPVGIFLLTGICLRHWLLAGAAVLFGYCHIRITWHPKKSPGS